MMLLADLTPTGAVCLAVSVHAAYSVPYFLFVDARLADFDPRPALARAVESGRYDALLVVVGPVKADARRAAARARRIPRDAAISAAALLALLTTPKGNLR
jgi:hypothetical protein